ncbi:hypothetical protein [Micromonospora sp. URMC 103]|uniref:hypothetical protein n=1 Tax=Micromonospora sp. URMC 103 TaxID=3423406 RepID=UPI003F1CB412
MRGGLDETLARMARREEALRRAAEAAEPVGADAAEPAGAEAAEPVGREPGAHRLDSDEAPDEDPVEAVAEAVRRIVAEHPGLAVTVRVEHGGQAYPLRVAWSGGEVTVAAEPTPPPAWPVSGRPVPAWPAGQDGPGHDPAARLAELIRRDPSLLTGHDRQR